MRIRSRNSQLNNTIWGSANQNEFHCVSNWNRELVECCGLALLVTYIQKLIFGLTDSTCCVNRTGRSDESLMGLREGVKIMAKKWISAVSVFLLIILGFSFHSIAGCKSDCREAYDTAVESCKAMYDDPNDAGMLATCVDEAKSEYESCIHECEN